MKSLKMFRNNQAGKIGYILLWLIGVPIPIFDFDISGAWLHLIGAKSLKIKKWAHDHTLLYALESKEQIIDLCKPSEV